MLALDAATGEIKGHHQYHHNGSWDWDEADPPLVLDIERNGRTIPALVHPGRNGYLWLLERSATGIGFVDAVPYVRQNVFTAIAPPGWRAHRLSGERQNEWSVSVSGNWRVTFEEENGCIDRLNLEDYH